MRIWLRMLFREKMQRNNLIPKSEANYITDIESNSFIKKTFKKFHKIKTEGDDVDLDSESNSEILEETDTKSSVIQTVIPIGIKTTTPAIK